MATPEPLVLAVGASHNMERRNNDANFDVAISVDSSNSDVAGPSGTRRSIGVKRTTGGRLGWLVAAVSIAVSGVTLTSAQPQQQAEPPLQGRILQRSDGVLYVYKDGFRFWVQPAPLGDDEIAAIPEAGPPVERVDQFFFPPTPTPVPPPPPTATPRPEPGDVLYRPDWGTGLAGWAGPSDWKTVGGMLVNAGSGQRSASVIVAPYQPDTPDYAIEAEIQFVQLGDYTGGFGIIARQEGRGEQDGYMGGVAVQTSTR
jgi:hypothetical protein